VALRQRSTRSQTNLCMMSIPWRAEPEMRRDMPVGTANGEYTRADYGRQLNFEDDLKIGMSRNEKSRVEHVMVPVL
jgi:hypothetical protein